MTPVRVAVVRSTRNAACIECRLGGVARLGIDLSLSVLARSGRGLVPFSERSLASLGMTGMRRGLVLVDAARWRLGDCFVACGSSQ